MSAEWEEHYAEVTMIRKLCQSERVHIGDAFFWKGFVWIVRPPMECDSTMVLWAERPITPFRTVRCPLSEVGVAAQWLVRRGKLV